MTPEHTDLIERLEVPIAGDSGETGVGLALKLKQANNERATAATTIRSLSGEVEALSEDMDTSRNIHKELLSELKDARELLERMVGTASLLHQNVEGCAINHHALDFAEQGLPGWLDDAQQEIYTARAHLSRTNQTEPEKV